MWLADYPKNQLSVVHRGFCINMDEGRCPVAIDYNGKLYELLKNRYAAIVIEARLPATDLVTSRY